MKTFLKNHARKILFGGAVLSAIFVATACSSSGSVDITRLDETESGKIVPLGNVTFDWGDIDIQGGNVDSPLFKFKNDGDGDLIIKTANTSCMCTTATITLSDSTPSPAFGMHEAVNWGGIVAPGEEFTVKAVFDPLAHGPDAVGPIDRFITITTSSVSNGNYAKKPAASHGHSGNVVSGNVTELTLSGNVLYKDDFAAKYPNGKPEVGTEKVSDEKVSEGDSVGTKASQQVDYINLKSQQTFPPLGCFWLSTCSEIRRAAFLFLAH